MARSLPRRGRGGKFVKGGGKRRRSSSSPRRRRRRSNPSRKRRRSYRSNPPRMSVKGMGRQLVQGAKDAAFILTGKAAARALPTMFKLPQAGMLGLGVQLGTALAVGFAADRFLGRDAGRFALAGGLTAPLETFIVAKNIPFLAPALSPATAAVQVGAYVQPQRGFSAYYQQRTSAPVQMEGRRNGMGAYVTAGGTYAMGDDY